MSDKHILIVDDDEELTGLMSAQLDAAGYATLCASDGGSAVRAIRSREPDLIVLDLGLPSGDGLELLHNLRTSTMHFAQTPVLVVTGRERDDWQAAALAAGAQGFLQKPVSKGDLLEALQRCLLASPEPAEPGEIAVLRALLASRETLVKPELDMHAPLGHAFPALDPLLGGPGKSLALLEDLADEGLLARELVNVVHACPHCSSCHLNLLETCPACGAFDLEVERILTHFPCAHVAPESAFYAEAAPVCPKCGRPLEELGRDFARTAESLRCGRCAAPVAEPVLEGQCLACRAVVPARHIRTVRIHGFRATARARRAVELGRITGLDLADALADPEFGLESWAFLVLELERELARLRSASTSFAVATLAFATPAGARLHLGDLGPVERRRLGELLRHGRGPLEIAARGDRNHLVLLLPGAGVDQLEAVKARCLAAVGRLGLEGLATGELQPAWHGACVELASTTVEQVLHALQRPLPGR